MPYIIRDLVHIETSLLFRLPQHLRSPLLVEFIANSRQSIALHLQNVLPLSSRQNRLDAPHFRPVSKPANDLRPNFLPQTQCRRPHQTQSSQDFPHNRRFRLLSFRIEEPEGH